MSLTSDENTVEISGSKVSVTGKTGPIHATWTLHVDGREVDTAAAAGDFTLRGELPDGSAVQTAIHQSLAGATEVVILHEDTEVGRFRGFVA